MAARRLDISSLLCADDAVPQPPPPTPISPLAHPPPAPPVADRRSTREYGYGSTPLSAPHVSALSFAGHSRDIVPLSLQPVHTRRHTPSPQSGEPLPPPSALWSSSKHSLSSILSSAEPPPNNAYYSSHRPQAESSRPSSARAPTSDPALHHPYAPTTTQALRPSSSRSAYSDTGPASLSYYSLRPPASLSPSLSPASTYSLPSHHHQRASQSPVLSRPVSASPAHYFQPHPLQPTYRSPQPSHYHSPRSPAAGHVTSISASPSQPYSNSQHIVQRPPPRPLPFPLSFSSPRSPPSMSEVPAPRVASAASLPSILNPVSPPSRSNAGGLGGLEALMEAATQESRRLSGEVDARRSTTPRASLSPVASRASVQMEPPSIPFHSPVASRVQQPPLAIDIPPAQYADDEPPLKKRRRSVLSPHGIAVAAAPYHRPSATATRSPSPPELRSPISNIRSELPPTLPGSPVRHAEPPSKPPAIEPPTIPKPRGLDALLNPEPVSSLLIAVARTKVASPPTLENEVVDQGRDISVKSRKRDRDRSVPKTRTNSQEPAQEKSVPNVEKTAAKEKKRKGSEEKTKGASKDNAKEVPKEPSKHEAAKSGARDDPHEWLLEHYTTPSPSEKPPPASPALEKPAFPHPMPNRPSEPKSVATHPSEDHAPHVTRVEVKARRSRTRTPTPVAMLEQELDGGRASEPLPGSSKRAQSESGASLELDLAAAATPDAGAAPNQDDLMDLDVDDELLSLIDDKPHELHKAKYVPPPSPNTPSQPSRPLPVKVDALPPPSPMDVQRASMPPPASTSVASLKDAAQGSSAKAKAKIADSASAASHHKKKDGVIDKPIVKSKAAPKLKTVTTLGAVKPPQKPKTKSSGSKEALSSAPSPAPQRPYTPSNHAPAQRNKGTPAAASPAVKRSVSAAAGSSRSRSASVMPPGSAGPDGKAQDEHEAEKSEDDEEDDKLYCVCKTPYDEDRVMIACDRCDEWYHTQCVNMPDVEVDLVDQFICPPCIHQNPHLKLRTTYKPRCLYGLKHSNPSSPEACHKPARGAFSKYCSDECGTAYMQSRIEAWGGDKSRLWESVKDARRREGVSVRVKKEEPVDDTPNLNGTARTWLERSAHIIEVVNPSMSRAERDAGRLNSQLERIARRRDELKKDMEVVVWREKLVEYATIRADGLDECGWDQRLCFGEEEYATYGASVLESYEVDGRKDSDRMQVDGMPEEGEWWCKGRKKCDRHAGWQKLRVAEVTYEKEVLESALSALTAQERDIRRQVEDAVDSKARTSSSANGPPLRPLNGKASLPGGPHVKPKHDPFKKGKKRKD